MALSSRLYTCVLPLAITCLGETYGPWMVYCGKARPEAWPQKANNRTHVKLYDSFNGVINRYIEMYNDVVYNHEAVYLPKPGWSRIVICSVES